MSKKVKKTDFLGLQKSNDVPMEGNRNPKKCQFLTFLQFFLQIYQKNIKIKYKRHRSLVNKKIITKRTNNTNKSRSTKIRKTKKKTYKKKKELLKG
jgi:hypothetical protein